MKSDEGKASQSKLLLKRMEELRKQAEKMKKVNDLIKE
jgi:hypothetical protein